jgi:murein DD-endopeptidase MepM/ murein hydrolase activator NlpD
MRSAPLILSYDARRRTARPPRTVTLSRWTVLLFAAGLALLGSWSLASLWYFASRDDLALRFLARQAATKRDYEEKIAALRAQANQASEAQKGEVERLQKEFRALLARQASLETRHAIVQALVDRAEPPPGGSALPAGPSAQGRMPENAYAPARAQDPNDPFRFRLRPAGDRTSALPRLFGDVQAAGHNLDELEAGQIRVLNQLTAVLGLEAGRLQGALRKVGLEAAVSRAAGTGGPLVPALEHDFTSLKLRAESAISRVAKLRRSVASLPFAEPIDGEIDLSSGFGYRIDPFTRAPAIHTGLDFRGEFGAPVRATGAGKVIVAENSGAYGNMVEIEHAHGVTSRYAHLSMVAVVPGQEVQAGTLLGRVGSTGRSTGPHLHYETRIGGDAVDPQRFLRAGQAIEPVRIAIR